MSHNIGILLTHPDPSSCGCRHGCAERGPLDTGLNHRQKWGWEIGISDGMHIRKHSTLQTIYLNALWMHTHACACFPCLCVWNQTSLAMGRREGPRYMFHFVHLPLPLNAWSLQNVAKVSLLLSPVEVRDGGENGSEFQFGMSLSPWIVRKRIHCLTVLMHPDKAANKSE